MADKRSAAEVRRAFWGGGEAGPEFEERLPPSPAERQAFLAAASLLPREKLRLLIRAVRAASGDC